MGEREAKRSLHQSARVGNADMSFPGKSRKTADLGRSDLWRPTVVDKTRGTNRNRALPGGSRWLSSQSARVGNADMSFPGKSRKTADLGRSDLWRPTVVDRTRGSNRNRALPGGSKWVQAQPVK